MPALPPTTFRQVLRLARLALCLQIVLVVSGSAVRATGSGLGCPTWPRCTGGSLANTPELGGHGYIEFGNRLLAVAMEVVGILLVVAVVRAGGPRSWRRLALVQAAVVPLQAVLGGLLVLSGLNPYVLVLHFLASFPLIAAAVALVQRVAEGGAERVLQVRPELRWLTRGLVLAAGAVLILGTAVTGTGPHAGDPKVNRMPFAPRDVTQLHADLVYLLIGLVLATAVAAAALDAPAQVRRGTQMMFGLILAQAALGYWQYFHGVPPALVVLHVLGASLIFTTAVWIVLGTAGPRAPALPPQNAPSRRQHAAGTAMAP